MASAAAPKYLLDGAAAVRPVGVNERTKWGVDKWGGGNDDVVVGGDAVFGHGSGWGFE